MDLCKKIAQLLLNATCTKITIVDTALIDGIRSELARIQDQAKSLIAEQDSIAMQLNFLKDQMNIARDPTSHIETRLFEILNLNEPETFSSLMLSFLTSFNKTCQSHITKQYIQQFIDVFSKENMENNINKSTAIDTIYAIDDGIDELLYILAKQKSNQTECEKLFEYYSTQLDRLSNKPKFEPTKRQDNLAIKALTKSTQQLLIKLKHSQGNLLKLYQEVTDYQYDHKVNFEIDRSFNLTRILQPNKTGTKEILFLNGSDETPSAPYEVYENSPIHFISAGNFGAIKVCQNLNTKRLHAILVQEDTLSSPLTITDLDPNCQKPFSSNINCLLNGIELNEHIEKRRQPSIENRLNIARQVALILDKVNQQQIQMATEITPMNFIWDDIRKQLYFCYLSLEPTASVGIKNTNLICIHTLGKLCQALFEAVDKLPSVIQTLINDLLSIDKAQSLDLQQVAKQLDELFITPTIPNGNTIRSNTSCS